MTLPLLRRHSAGLVGAIAPQPLIKLKAPPAPMLGLGEPSEFTLQPARRSKIWELADSLHCSIIGTCLSNAELRQVLVRLNVPNAEKADEHELHVLGVTLAGRRDAGAKVLQKALDRRHALTIKLYGGAKDEAALRGLWEQSAQRGDIPGAYWALLSHPATTEAVVKKAFQHVHMLSHLVGAANRADIRRLRQLEDENAALLEKVARQQAQLREGFTARDVRIRQLSDLIAAQVKPPVAQSHAGAGAREEIETLRTVIADVNAKLGQETARRERLEQRVNAVSATLQATEAALKVAEAVRDAAIRDIEVIEDHVLRMLEPDGVDRDSALDLGGRTILYVGGRAHQIPQMKALVERTGACFLHHDGGLEHNAGLLPGLVSRADVSVFPIDCISHNAVAAVKRLCRQLQKPYLPLRTASLAALMSSLANMITTPGALPDDGFVPQAPAP